MRTGPSTEFPVKWVYKRQNMPVKVVAVHSVWRKVEDPDGDQGWMHVRLLSPKRTAVVVGSGVGAFREAPEGTARIAWRVEPGVVGRYRRMRQRLVPFRKCGPLRLISKPTGYGATKRFKRGSPRAAGHLPCRDLRLQRTSHGNSGCSVPIHLSHQVK